MKHNSRRANISAPMKKRRLKEIIVKFKSSPVYTDKYFKQDKKEKEDKNGVISETLPKCSLTLEEYSQLFENRHAKFASLDIDPSTLEKIIRIYFGDEVSRILNF